MIDDDRQGNRMTNAGVRANGIHQERNRSHLHQPLGRAEEDSMRLVLISYGASSRRARYTELEALVSIKMNPKFIFLERTFGCILAIISSTVIFSSHSGAVHKYPYA